MDVLVALAVGLVGVVFVALLFYLFGQYHEVYDPGDGSVKIRCPETAKTLTIYGWPGNIQCPECGTLLEQPTKRNAWQKR